MVAVSSFGLCEPTQLSLLLYSLFFFFFLFPDSVHRLFVCASTSANHKPWNDTIATYYVHLNHFSNKAFIVKQSMPSNPKRYLQENVYKFKMIIIVIDILFS